MGELRAAEILTSGVCPLSCTYCYVPKSEAMKKTHEKIIDDLKSSAFIPRLKTAYDDNLEYLGFWGTEPLLTLPLIEKHLSELLKQFPKLKSIGFSTSLMVFPERILSFAKALTRSISDFPARKISFKVQISLDGPAFITDINRMKGAAEAIPKNFFNLIHELNDIDLGNLKLSFSWKATHSIANIRFFVEHPEKLDDYFQYFDDLSKRFKKENKNPNVALRNSYYPTLVMPGKYTSDDGKKFTQYLREFHKRGRLTAYTLRVNKFFRHESEIFKRRAFSCSGGDSNFGLGEKAHICHRTFYYDNDEYIESILNTDIENWDVSLFRRGTIEHIRNNYIVDVNNLTRFRYVLRGYHDFWGFPLNYTRAMMTELALAGQVEKIESPDLMERFALFINCCLSCPMESLLNTGSIHLQVVSLLRMFGNGAFMEILKSLSILWKTEKNELSRRE